jgi:pyridoxine kinase
MARILILSSLVAASPVGGYAQARLLSGHEVALAPTVLFGRHPGLGAPGGGAVSPQMLSGVLEGIFAAWDRIDAVLTGYFAAPEQVLLAAAALDQACEGGRTPVRIVDPILGDSDTGPYVRPGVEEALRAHLLSRADILTPNAWEAERLTGVPAGDPDGARAAIGVLGMPCLISSVRRDGRIGAVFGDRSQAWYAHTHESPAHLRGAGDRLAAGLVSALLEGCTVSDLAARAVETVALDGAAVLSQPL